VCVCVRARVCVCVCVCVCIYIYIYIYIYLSISFTNSFIAPALCNVRTFQVAILISLILFHCIGWFHSECSKATVKVSYLSFFMVTGRQAVAYPQQGGPVHHICNTRQGDPAIPPSTGHPFWSPFTACMGCSGTILFPSHHMGNV